MNGFEFLQLAEVYSSIINNNRLLGPDKEYVSRNC